jgi:hypothetical protein
MSEPLYHWYIRQNDDVLQIEATADVQISDGQVVVAIVQGACAIISGSIIEEKSS